MPARKLVGPPVFSTPDPWVVSLFDAKTGEPVLVDLRDGPVEFDDGKTVSRVGPGDPPVVSDPA